MTAESFSAGNYSRQNAPQEREEGSFNTRVTVTQGTRTPSGLKAPVGSPDAGNIHRSSVKEYKQVDTTQVYSSVHRPDHSPSEPLNLADLKAHQERMITDKQKAKHKKAK